jgi:hypothetical protein
MPENLPSPRYRRELDDVDSIHLHSELPLLDDAQRSELAWWIARRSDRHYPADRPPAEALEQVTTHEIVSRMRARDAELQQADWLLAWYFLSLVSRLDARERRVLSSPVNASVALLGLAPLPPWAPETHLGRSLEAFGVYPAT